MAFGLNGGSSAEANLQFDVRVAGTFSKLGVKVNATGSGRSMSFRKNGSAGSQSVSPTNTTAGWYEGTGTDTVAAGDLVSYGNAVSTTIFMLRNLFEAASNHVVLLSSTSASGVNITSASATTYIGLQGNISANNTEANRKHRLRVAGTVKGGHIYITANARTTTTTYRMRVNGANGNIAIAVGAGLTGLFEDTVNTDTVAAGDDLCWSLTTGAGTETLTHSHLGLAIESTNATNDIFSGSGINRNASATANYYTPGGAAATSTTEDDRKIQHGFAATTTRLRIYLTANSYTTDGTLTLRKNGAAGNQGVTLTAGTTGLFEDTTHTDTFVGTDDATFEINGGTSGAITFSYIGLTEQDTSAPTVYNQSLSANAATQVSLVRGAAAAKAASTSPTASMARASSLVRALTTAPVAGVVKATSTARQLFTAPQASLLAQKVKLQSLAASTSPLARLARTTGKGIAASTSRTVFLLRAVGIRRSVSQAPGAAITRAITKRASTSTSTLATLTASYTAFAKLRRLTRLIFYRR
jgi:hypothetical protein